jgi:FKBP-type peptidyl-prolyl cis-trans isomerase FklB
LIRLLTLSLVALSFASTAVAQPPRGPAPPKSKLQTLAEQRSYALGVSVGKGFNAQDITLEPNSFLQGVMDAATGGKLALSENDIREILTTFERELMEQQAERNKVEGKANEEKGNAFLAANAKKEGVKTTKSGLQYKIVKPGNGKMPKATDVVKTHYEGRLIDGTVFDSSYERGEPASFPVNRVIPGWTEALQLMPMGSKWQLYIPSKLAYGPEGAPPDIPPNATLIFDIELLGIGNAPAGGNPQVQ